MTPLPVIIPVIPVPVVGLSVWNRRLAKLVRP